MIITGHSNAPMNESVDQNVGYFVLIAYSDPETMPWTEVTCIAVASSEGEAIKKARKYWTSQLQNHKVYKEIHRVEIDTSRGTKGKCLDIEAWRKKYPHSNFEVIK